MSHDSGLHLPRCKYIHGGKFSALVVTFLDLKVFDAAYVRLWILPDQHHGSFSAGTSTIGVPDLR